MWKPVVFYGGALALGAALLAWVDYQRLARTHFADVYLFLVGLACLALGVYIGARVLNPAKPSSFDGNPQALASLKISPAEHSVLEQLAAGYSNKEIAAKLELSPNTVKTHCQRLFEKLGAKRRTDAINRARELGILP